MIEAYQGQDVIIRAHTPSDGIQSLSENDLEHLVYLQLLSAASDLDPLIQWGSGIPIDIVMGHPQTDFPGLYKYAKLLPTHPVRVSMPVVSGFSKAVKLAVSLNFAVKLDVEQPDKDQIKELSQVLSFYLHHSTVSQPIEFFHSVFLALYHQTPLTLWTLQEEDPTVMRYITDQGEETISRRFVGVSVNGDIGTFVKRFTRSLLEEQCECVGCEFFDQCGGYFKWPHTTFRCDGVKMIFGRLRDTAGELREDLKAFGNLKGQD
jgi:hypothetical protein